MVGELDDPVVAGLPLRGEWPVETTPAYQIPSHGTDHRPGFHLHPAGTVRSSLIGGRTRDCYGWVLFSVALFFAGMSAELQTPALRKTLLVLGSLLFLGTVAWIATFPASVSI